MNFSLVSNALSNCSSSSCKENGHKLATTESHTFSVGYLTIMSVSDTTMSNNRLTNDELEKKCQEAAVAYLQYNISRCKGREKTIKKKKTARLVCVPDEIRSRYLLITSLMYYSP
jgi:hypothetical protein